MKTFEEMAADHQHNLHGIISLFLNDEEAQNLKPLLDAKDFIWRGMEPYNRALVDAMRAKGLRIDSPSDVLQLAVLSMVSRKTMELWLSKVRNLLPKWRDICEHINSVEGPPTAAHMKKALDLGVGDFLDDAYEILLVAKHNIYDTFEVPEDKRPPRAVVMMMVGCLPLALEFLAKAMLRNADIFEAWSELASKYFPNKYKPAEEELEELPEVEDAA